MMAGQPVHAAVIGLGFGAEFIPICQRHPQAEMAAICSHPYLVHEYAPKGDELVRLPEFTLGDKGSGTLDGAGRDGR